MLTIEPYGFFHGLVVRVQFDPGVNIFRIVNSAIYGLVWRLDDDPAASVDQLLAEIQQLVGGHELTAVLTSQGPRAIEIQVWRSTPK